MSPFQFYFLSPVQLRRTVMEWFGRHLVPSLGQPSTPVHPWSTALDLGEHGGFHEAISV